MDAKSVIIDIADNWGSTNLMALRAVNFYNAGSLLEFAAADYTAYATTTRSIAGYFSPSYVFETSRSLTGTINYTTWESDFEITNQRIICVFDTTQTFDEVGICNSHDNGGSTNVGIKNIVVQTSTDSITSTVYGSAVSNATELYDGEFPAHIESDVADEQTIWPGTIMRFDPVRVRMIQPLNNFPILGGV